MKLTAEQLQLMRYNLAQAMYFTYKDKKDKSQVSAAYFIQQAQKIVDPEAYELQKMYKKDI